MRVEVPVHPRPPASDLKLSRLVVEAPVTTGGGACRSCGAPIIWLKHFATGNVAPIDAKPSPNGHIAINLEAGTWDAIPARAVDKHAGPLHLSHFATCPNADAHRKRR